MAKLTAAETQLYNKVMRPKHLKGLTQMRDHEYDQKVQSLHNSITNYCNAASATKERACQTRADGDLLCVASMTVANEADKSRLIELGREQQREAHGWYARYYKLKSEEYKAQAELHELWACK